LYFFFINGEVIGWSMSKRIDSNLVIEALKMAVLIRMPFLGFFIQIVVASTAAIISGYVKQV